MTESHMAGELSYLFN